MSLTEVFSQPQAWISLLTLAGLEIVLGIDNIVFITIVSGRLPEEKRLFARRLGLALALITRMGLLFSLTWVMSLNADLFTLWGAGISGRDLILILGGLFLLAKATFEIYDKVEAAHPIQDAAQAASAAASQMVKILIQIALLDIVFSLDSVITAVGMVQELPIMVAAVVIAMIVMMIFAGPVGDFVERHPSVKILALSFLIMIGAMLVAEGFDQHIPKGYIYFAMAFSLGIEMLNIRYRTRQARLETVRSKAEHRP